MQTLLIIITTTKNFSYTLRWTEICFGLLKAQVIVRRLQITPLCNDLWSLETEKDSGDLTQ